MAHAEPVELDAGGEYHCPLLTLFAEPARPLWADPSYYEWAFCVCEYGFYVDPGETPQQPHCTPFPVLINVTELQGQFTDGTSGGAPPVHFKDPFQTPC